MNDGWDDLNIMWLCGFYFINNNCYYYRVFNMIINIELIEICYSNGRLFEHRTINFILCNAFLLVNVYYILCK